MIVVGAIDHPTYACSDANCEGLFVNFKVRQTTLIFLPCYLKVQLLSLFSGYILLDLTLWIYLAQNRPTNKI